MSVLNLIQYPDPLLSKPSVPVDLTNGVPDEIRVLLLDMAETMYSYHGVGISAVQVGTHVRVILYDVMQDQPKGQLKVLINPVLSKVDGTPFVRTKDKIELKGDVISTTEGCLSMPFVFDYVQRMREIKVNGFDMNGQPVEFIAAGDEAVCIQHEVDHCDGIVFTDRMSRLKKKLAMDMSRKRITGSAKNMLTKLYVEKKALNLM